jgi:hypothetical protein
VQYIIHTIALRTHTHTHRIIKLVRAIRKGWLKTEAQKERPEVCVCARVCVCVCWCVYTGDNRLGHERSVLPKQPACIQWITCAGAACVLDVGQRRASWRGGLSQNGHRSVVHPWGKAKAARPRRELQPTRRVHSYRGRLDGCGSVSVCVCAHACASVHACVYPSCLAWQAASAACLVQKLESIIPVAFPYLHILHIFKSSMHTCTYMYTGTHSSNCAQIHKRTQEEVAGHAMLDPEDRPKIVPHKHNSLREVSGWCVVKCAGCLWW